MSNRIISITADKNVIKVLIDNKVTLEIKSGEKTINGDLIYSSLDFHYGDVYQLSQFAVDEKNADKNYNASLYLYQLYKDIVDGIGKIEIPDENTEEK